MCDLLEVQCFDQSEELVLRILDRVVDQLVSEEDRVVCHFELADGLADSHLELLLSLDSVANTASELLETRWIDEQEVAFVAASGDLQGTLDVDLQNGNLAQSFNTLKLASARAIEAALGALTVLNELVVLDHALELSRLDESEVLLTLLIVGPHGSGRHTSLPVKDVAVLLEHVVNQSALADARGTNQDQWLILLRSRIERVEVLLGVHEDVVGLRKQHGGEEVIEHLPDLQMLHDVLVMLRHQLVLAGRQVRQDLIIEIHVGLHR